MDTTIGPMAKKITKKISKKPAVKARTAPSVKPTRPPVKKASKKQPAAAPPRPAAKKIDESKSLAFAVEAARLASDDKCEDVVLLDVRNLSPMTDFIVIASGTSDRQMRSVLTHMEDIGKTTGNTAHRVSADDRATWLIADFVDVVVHLFEPTTRGHYDLEMMWGDAKKVKWERPAGASRRP